MFIGAHHQKLKDKLRGFGTQFLFPLDDVARALKNQLQLATFAVLCVYFLGAAVYRNDQAIES
jgi:hypothetical protein